MGVRELKHESDLEKVQPAEQHVLGHERCSLWLHPGALQCVSSPGSCLLFQRYLAGNGSPSACTVLAQWVQVLKLKWNIACSWQRKVRIGQC